MLPIIKAYLSIDDSIQDEILLDIIETYTARVNAYVKADTLPKQLEWIVKELTIIRYNSLGSEGLASESEEGKSLTFRDGDPFNNYLDDLDRYNESQEQPSGRGRVKFL